MVSHTGTILTAAAADKNDAVLLDVVAHAGNVGSDLAAIGQSDTGGLSLARVGLLGLLNADLDADTLQHGAGGLGEGGRDGVTSALSGASALRESQHEVGAVDGTRGLGDSRVRFA